MFCLCLAIVCSTLVSVVMRVGSSGEEARKPMLAVNYLTCAAVSLCFLRGRPVPKGSGAGVALGMGLAGGVLYLGAFLLLQKNVRESGVTLSSAFMKLGVVVPTLLGFAVFGERAGWTRVAGIALTLAAILVLAGGPAALSGRSAGAGKLPALVLLMLWGGMADGLSKFYEAWGDPALEGHFLCCVFTCALALCAGLCAVQRQRPRARDWLFGLLLGVPNYFSSRFLLLALSQVPASAAFPVFSCGTLLLTALVGRLAFGERIDRRQGVTLGMVAVALALLNA